MPSCRVEFVCPGCNRDAVSTAEVPELEFDAEEGMPALEAQDDTDIRCNHCGEEFNAAVHRAGGSCAITFYGSSNRIRASRLDDERY